MPGRSAKTTDRDLSDVGRCAPQPQGGRVQRRPGTWGTFEQAYFFAVVPAKAGRFSTARRAGHPVTSDSITCSHWIPAFAGMTRKCRLFRWELSLQRLLRKAVSLGHRVEFEQGF